MFEAFFISAITIFIYASLWFIISLIIKRNDIADIAWGLGYILLVLFFLFQQNNTYEDYLLYILIILWGLRLSIHIFIRNQGKTEDYRYNQWRKEWGKYFYIRSYLQIYLLQGFLLILIASPIILTSVNTNNHLNFLSFLGLIIWFIGFYFKSVGDYQLAKFLKNPENKGKILKTGLWQYTRHPNYFGEVTMWWGIFLIVVNLNNFVYALMSPLTITILILFISGVPLLEKKYQGDPEFEKYKKETNKFFPSFRKNKISS
ncbi:DUF1295 domain-containing protein [Candidatus Nomurabacteria bacterium]|nr:DUF1295 domain-containing protein [Candidatus Nomurabacteria bacterium]